VFHSQVVDIKEFIISGTQLALSQFWMSNNNLWIKNETSKEIVS
jgi:hypothetical protein